MSAVPGKKSTLHTSRAQEAEASRVCSLPYPFDPPTHIKIVVHMSNCKRRHMKRTFKFRIYSDNSINSEQSRRFVIGWRRQMLTRQGTNSVSSYVLSIRLCLSEKNIQGLINLEFKRLNGITRGKVPNPRPYLSSGVSRILSPACSVLTSS